MYEKMDEKTGIIQAQLNKIIDKYNLYSIVDNEELDELCNNIEEYRHYLQDLWDIAENWRDSYLMK